MRTDKVDKKSELYGGYIKRLMPGYIAIFLVTIFTFLVILSIFFSWENEKRKNRNYNRTLCAEIGEVYRQYNDALDELAQDPTILQAVKGGGTTGVVAALRTVSRSLSIPCNYILLNDARKIVYTNLFSVNYERCLNSVDILLILGRISEDPHSHFEGVSNAGYLSGQESVYHFGTAILENGVLKGYLILDVRQRPINDLLFNGPCEIVIMDQYQNIVYTTLNANNFYVDNSRGVKWNSDYTIPEKVTINGMSYYATRATGEQFGQKNISIITLTANNYIKKQLQMLLIYIGIVSFILLFSILFVADKNARMGMQALDRIFESTEKWDQGNIGYRLPTQSNAELQRVCRGINALMDKAEQLINRNAALTDINYKMELRNMEAQFNPHFVFNILETIKCMTMIEPEKAGEMIVSFANLLRYSINYGTDIVNVKKDLDYIEAYLKLQKQRLGDRLFYIVSIQSKVLNFKIPKLILQPLVENAITHNIDYVDKIEVEITGVLKENDIIFVVADNGRGIAEDKLIEIQKKMEQGASIGLYHVDRTLRLRYGEQYRLKIESAAGKGLRATVRIPLKGRTNNGNESNHS